MSNPAQAVEASSAEEEPSAEEDTPSSLDAGAVERFNEGAPSWLSERRRHAWSVFEDTPLPSTRSEEWRYTDVSRLLKFADLRVAPDGASGEEGTRPPGLTVAMDEDEAAAGHTVVVDGRVVHGRSRSSARAARGNSYLAAFRSARTRRSSRRMARHRDLAARGRQIPGAQRRALVRRRAPLRPPEREARSAGPDHALALARRFGGLHAHVDRGRAGKPGLLCRGVALRGLRPAHARFVRRGGHRARRSPASIRLHSTAGAGVSSVSRHNGRSPIGIPSSTR